MPWERSWNFRSTAAFVNDRPPETCELSAAYPQARNGVRFGWTGAGPGGGRDRSSAVDRRLAGIVFTANGAGSQATFRVDIPGPGRYEFRVALGDQNFSDANHYIQVKSLATGQPLLTLALGATSNGQFFDATGTLLTAAEWPALNRPALIDCPAGPLAFTIGHPTGVQNTALAHLSLRKVEPSRIARLVAAVAVPPSTPTRPSLARPASGNLQAGRAPAGTAFAAPLNRSLADAAGGRQGAVSGGPSFVAGRWGDDLAVTSGTPIVWPAGGPISGSYAGPIALWAACRVDSISGVGCFPVATCSDGHGYALQVLADGSLVLNLFGATAIDSGLDLTLGERHALAISRTAAGAITFWAYRYADGVLQRSTASDATAPTSGDGQPSINRNPSGLGFTGRVATAGIASDPWTDADFARFAADPFRMFRPGRTPLAAILATITGSPATVAPSGVASSESFGTAVLTPGPVSLSPPGVASAEAFGTAVLTVGAVSVSPSGIASSETFGTATVSAGGSVLAPSGIVSAEGFGTATLTPGAATVSPSGIASSESFGVAAFGSAGTITPAGIGTGEAFGTPTISTPIVPENLLFPSGIASAEAFGTASFGRGTVTISPTGIDSSTAFGVAILTGGDPSTLPADLFAAITADFNTTGPGTIGRLYTTKAGDSAAYPYGVVEVRPGRLERRYSDVEVHRNTLIARVFVSGANGEAQAMALGKLLDAWLSGRGWRYEDGVAQPLISESGPKAERRPRGTKRGDGEVWSYQREFTLRERRDV